MEAVSHAGRALGILANYGLVITAKNQVTSKLLDNTSEGAMIYIMNGIEESQHLIGTVICGVAGIKSDVSISINCNVLAPSQLVPRHLETGIHKEEGIALQEAKNLAI
ncbi:hypothetical protein EC957_011186 [Mortierella hygrophila]|uniref:Uncharacterized protein n=1 Tax=Mortierella hygrophila TaxID=979708 RepID=A0A9P6F854_9FUNG|nr:hypothetical protein EC957_011186 [Mortierella hygrophila]